MNEKDIKKICFNSLESAITKANKALISHLLKLDFGKGRVFVVGWGKSVDPFINTIMSMIPQKKLAGCKYLSLKKNLKRGKEERISSTHPLISKKNLKGSKIILDFLRKAKEKDTVLIVSTGGGSSMFEVLKPNISLNQAKKTMLALLKNNADCRTINFTRRCCSEVKGGKLLNYIQSKKIITFIVSDDVLTRNSKACAMHVASGPTKRFPITEKGKKEIIKKLENFGITKIVPKTIFLKKEDGRNKKVKHIVLLDNLSLLKILKKNFSNNRIETKIRKRPYFEESCKIAYKLIKEFSGLSGNKKPFAYICGGESTVKIEGKGKGGRMQELIGHAIKPLSEIDNSYIFGIGTDGRDYIKGIAGAYANTDTYKNIKFDFEKYLAENNTYNLHKRLRSLVESPKHTINVGDIIILLKNKNGKKYKEQ